MPQNRSLKIIILFFLWFFLAIVGNHTGGFQFDLDCFKTWTLHIFNHGLSRAYTEWNNYMPFYQYVMYLFGKLAGDEETIGRFLLAFIKGFTLLFDILGLWFVYKWIDKKTDFLLLVLFNLLNIGYVYNSFIWGQLDAIYSTMVFIAMYYAYRQKLVFSMVWYVLALNMKLQAIVFLPPLLLMHLLGVVQTKKYQQIIFVLGIAAVCQLLILWPFLTIPNGFGLFWKEVTSATTIYPKVTNNAFNIWCLLFKDFPFWVDDNLQYVAGLSYMQVGLLLFFLTSFMALFPLLRSVYLAMFKNDRQPIPREKLWLICALVAMLFFYCNTQMHERYCHPTLIFMTAYAFFNRDFVPYILFCIAYFLNLEKLLNWLWLVNYNIFMFDVKLVAGIYALLIVYMFVRLYQKPKQIPM